MYNIASLIRTPLQFTQAQVVEALVVFTAFMFLQFAISRMLTVASVAEAEAGAVRSLPSSFVGRIVSPVHSLTTLIPPVVYILCVALNRFTQPNWMQRMSVPNNHVHQGVKVVLRVAACVSTFALLRLFEYALSHLGNQWHVIGRREKSKLVQTGPYAMVRHPAYMTVLIQQALFSVMFWSYVPLAGLGIIAAAFTVKMPIEEDLIMKDSAVAAEYRAYMRRVPARVFPFIW